MKANKFVIKPEKYALIEQVIQPVIELMKVHADIAKVIFEFRSFVQEDPHVQVDKLRTQQILINLIQNAIKFSF